MLYLYVYEYIGTIIGLLSILTITALSTTFSLRSVLSNFNTNCIVNAHIQFTNATKLELPQDQLNNYQDKFRRIYQRDIEEKIKQSDRVTEIFSFLNRKSKSKSLPNDFDFQMIRNDSNMFATGKLSLNRHIFIF